MELDDALCLRWNDFQSTILRLFDEMRDNDAFFDIILTTDDNESDMTTGLQEVRAHKAILSASSSVFQAMLMKHSHMNQSTSTPIIFLRGVASKDLKYILNFIYQGEVNVPQDDLSSFLAVADSLKIRGLAHNQEGASKREPVSKSRKIGSANANVTNNPDEDSSTMFIKNEPQVTCELDDPLDDSMAYGGQNNNDDDDDHGIDDENGVNDESNDSDDSCSSLKKSRMAYDDEEDFVQAPSSAGPASDTVFVVNSPMEEQALIKSKVKKTEAGFVCMVCFLCTKTRKDVCRHFTAKHCDNGLAYLCPVCKKTWNVRRYFIRHVTRTHNTVTGIDYDKCIIERKKSL